MKADVKEIQSLDPAGFRKIQITSIANQKKSRNSMLNRYSHDNKTARAQNTRIQV